MKKRKLNGNRASALIRTLITAAMVLLSFSSVIFQTSCTPYQTPGTASELSPAQPPVTDNLEPLPLYFIRNQGQLASDVAYYLNTPAQTLYFSTRGITFEVSEANGGDALLSEKMLYRLNFIESSEQCQISGRDLTPTTVNYLVGNNSDDWYQNLATYRELYYSDVYPGIDLRFYGSETSLEYDFVISPGSDVTDIRLSYDGIRDLTLVDGQLVAQTAAGDLYQNCPYIYQDIYGERVQVNGGL